MIPGWDITSEFRTVLNNDERLNLCRVAVSGGVLAVSELSTDDTRQLVRAAYVVLLCIHAKSEEIEPGVTMVALPNTHRFILLHCKSLEDKQKGLLVLTYWEWMVAGRGFPAFNVEVPPRVHIPTSPKEVH